MRRPAFLAILLAIVTCSGTAAVKTGADILVERRLDILRGRQVGLVTNQTGRLSNGAFLVDALLKDGIRVTALFGPEHGIRGNADEGARIADGRDPKTGITVFSLYGRTNKPTPEMLRGVDILVYDIQDVGARFYTYISTLSLVMEAAAESHIPVVVLDRPNPLGGLIVDGPVRVDSLASFVAFSPIPVVYGLTCGELATMINEEHWLANRVTADLTVIPMEGWQRSMFWPETGLRWIAPSPNIPTFRAALAYPATCFIEATNLSEGRGTRAPFTTFGAPFIDGPFLAGVLAGRHHGDIRFSSVDFTPRRSKHTGQLCHGVALEVTATDAYHPVRLGVDLLLAAAAACPDSMHINVRGLNRLMGDPEVVRMILEGGEAARIAASWEDDVTTFRERSKRYYKYP